MKLETTDKFVQLSGSMHFADFLCKALGVSTYITTMYVGEENAMVSVGGWAGVPLQEPSRSNYVANAKAAELLYGGSETGLSLTPIKNFDMGFGWMGGVRLDDYIVAVSGLSQEHDRILALVIAYAQKVGDVYLHHAGFRYPTPELMQSQVSQFEQPLKIPGRNLEHVYTRKPVDPHQVDGEDYYYEEAQYFPKGHHDSARHLDFYTPDSPSEFLRFIASGFNVTPELWQDPKENDPIGSVSVADRHGDILAIMARPNWWEIEKSL